jgi:hypothetical protein
MDNGLKSFRCLGETRTGRQCSQRCVSLPNEHFSFCAEHEVQRSIRLIDFNAQEIVLENAENYTWRRLGIGDTENTTLIKQVRQERNLKDLSDDDENIHTIEIQRPLMQAISSLRIWAESINIKIEHNLGKTVEDFLKLNYIKKQQEQEKSQQESEETKILILKEDEPQKSTTKKMVPTSLNMNNIKFTQTIVNEFWTGSIKTISSTSTSTTNTTTNLLKNTYLNTLKSNTVKNDIQFTKIEKDCIDHLNRVYSVDDTETVLGITFPVLSSWVWNRVIKTEDKSRKDELVKRFIEEMAESKGLCLQGNLTRLMNVFSGLDAEMSIQEVDISDTGPISQSYMQQQVSAAVTRFSKKLITYEELLTIFYSLMKRSNASKEVVDDWLKAIEDYVL